MNTSIKFVIGASVVGLVLALCVCEAVMTLNHRKLSEVDALMLGRQNQVQEKPKLKQTKNQRCVDLPLARKAGKAGICAAIAMGAAKYGPACSYAQTHVSALQLSDQHYIQNSLNLPRVSLDKDKGRSHLKRTPLFATTTTTTTTMTQSSTSTQPGSSSKSKSDSKRSTSTKSSTKSESGSKSSFNSRSTTKSSSSPKSTTTSSDTSSSSSSSSDDSCSDGVLVEFNLPEGLSTEQLAEKCFLVENSFKILTCRDAYKSTGVEDSDGSTATLRPIVEGEQGELAKPEKDSDDSYGWKLKPYSTCSRELAQIENYVVQLNDDFGDGWVCDLCPKYYDTGNDEQSECEYDEKDRYVYPYLSLTSRVQSGEKNGESEKSEKLSETSSSYVIQERIYTMGRPPLITEEEGAQLYYNFQENFIVSDGGKDNENEKCSSLTTDCHNTLYRSDNVKLQKFSNTGSETNNNINGQLGNGICNDNAVSLNPMQLPEGDPVLNCPKFDYDNGDCINNDCLGTGPFSRFPAFSIRKSEEVDVDGEDSNSNSNSRDTEGENPFPKYSKHGWLGDGVCDALRYEEDVGEEPDAACDEWNLDGGDCMVACNGMLFESEYGVYKDETSKETKYGSIADGYCDNWEPDPSDGDFRKTDSPNLHCEQYYYDGGDCMTDCNGVYFDRYKYGDGECDEGDSSIPENFGKTRTPDLNCAELEYDGGDCLVVPR